jgi:hypothetical protein
MRRRWAGGEHGRGHQQETLSRADPFPSARFDWLVKFV